MYCVVSLLVFFLCMYDVFRNVFFFLVSFVFSIIILKGDMTIW